MDVIRKEAHHGWIEVITGSMFSGKSEELIRRLRRAQIAKQKGHVSKPLAICVVCGDPANHTQRLVASSDRVLVGATGVYEARCRHCFDPTLALVEKV